MAATPLPSRLFLTYLQYKSDTEIIAGWLVETSSKLGFKPSSAQTTHGRLKGRARKEARETTNRKSLTSIKVFEFLTMADMIAAEKPQISMPSRVRKVLVRAIDARERCIDWFDSVPEASVYSNDKHMFFNNVLKLTLAAIAPAPKPTKSKSDATTTTTSFSPKKPPTSSNIFSHLHLHNTKDVDESNQSEIELDEYPNQEKLPKAAIELSIEEIELEFHFAIWSFLSDIHPIGVYIEQVWHMYKQGSLELMVATVVTNTAIDLVKRAEEEFELDLKRPEGYELGCFPTGDLPSLIIKHHLERDRVIPGTTLAEMEQWSANAGLKVKPVVLCECTMCAYCFQVPRVIVDGYLAQLKGDPIQRVTLQDPQIRLPPSTMSKFDGDIKSANILIDKLPDLIALSILHDNHFGEDRILHAARHIYEARQVPIWASFALNTYIKLQETMESHPTMVLQDLKASISDHKLRFAKFKIHLQQNQIVNDDLMTLETIFSELQEFVTDSAVGYFDPENRCMLSNFPLTCGALKVELHVEWHICGLKTVNNTRDGLHVIVMIHLYNAALLVDASLPKWPDMQLVLQIQSASQTFIGGPPKTIEEAHRRFMLFIGQSPQTLARNSRASRSDVGGSKIRLFKISPLCKILLKRFLGQKGRGVDQSTHELEKLLLGEKYGKGVSQFLPSILQKASMPETPDRNTGSKPIFQTLLVLQESLCEEMPAFCFDFFSAQEQCFDMFLEIGNGLSNLIKLSPSGDGRSESRKACYDANSAVIIGVDILRAAITSEEFVRQCKSVRRERKKPSYSKKIDCSVEDRPLLATLDKSIEFHRLEDIPTNYAATVLMQPLFDCLKKHMHAGHGDKEIRRLRNTRGTTDYGTELYDKDSLKTLYGKGSESAWKDIQLSSAELKKVLNTRLVLCVVSTLLDKRFREAWSRDDVKAKNEGKNENIMPNTS